jgi:hypothetical protein
LNPFAMDWENGDVPLAPPGNKGLEQLSHCDKTGAQAARQA